MKRPHYAQSTTNNLLHMKNSAYMRLQWTWVYKSSTVRCSVQYSTDLLDKMKTIPNTLQQQNWPLQSVLLVFLLVVLSVALHCPHQYAIIPFKALFSLPTNAVIFAPYLVYYIHTFGLVLYLVKPAKRGLYVIVHIKSHSIHGWYT